MGDGPQNSLLDAWIKRLKESGASTTDSALHHTSWCVGQYGQYTVCSLIQKYGICNRKGDGRASDLCEGNEANGRGDFFWLDFDLSNCEAGLYVHAASDPEDDGIAVDFRDGGVGLDGVHQSATDKGEDAASEIPGHVVAVFRHKGAVQDDGEDEHADERKETDAGFDGGVVSRELEKEGNEVDGNEDEGDGGGHLHEEDDEGFVFEELAGEDSGFFCGQDTEGLLKAEDDKQDARDDETGDGLAGVPGVDDSTEVYCHYAGDTGADHEERSEVV